MACSINLFLSIFFYLILKANFVQVKSCTCGRNLQNQRIVGGVESKPNSHLWIAALATEDLNEIVCGGSLINNRYILTAAHCLAQFDEDEIKVALGAHSKKNLNTTADIYIPNKFIIHQNYNLRDPYQLFDIALIRLKKNVKFTNKVQPICLPDNDSIDDLDSLIVAGWGKTLEKSEPSDLLIEAEVPFVELEKCVSLYNPNIITERHLCAGNEEKDSCYGDSGGPLTYFNESNIAIQVGLVSWGIECAAKRPGVYTKIQSYLNWIYTNTEDSLRCS